MKFVTLVLLLTVAVREPLLAQTYDGVPSQTSGGCVVPNVIGLSRAEATIRLRRSKLEPGRIENRVAEQEAGTVIDQQPRQCGEPTGNRVDLSVSSGPASSDVAAGGKRGSSVGDIAVPVGVAVGAAVIGSILARRSDGLTTVPDLVSKPESAVDQALKKAHLRKGEFTGEDSTNAPAGMVISQLPIAGTRVPRESIVNVTVSSGLPLTEVPDVMGLEWRRAGARTTEARLRMLVTEPSLGEFAGMIVTSQTPAAGTRVLVGGTVGVALQAPAPAARLSPDSPSPPPATPTRPIPAAPLGGNSGTAVPQATGQERTPSNQLGTNPAAVNPIATNTPTIGTTPPSQPLGPVAIVTPGVPTWTNWAWLLLVLAVFGLIPVAERIRKRLSDNKEPQPQAPSLGARVTFRPRLDSGRQMIMPTDSLTVLGIDVICQVDMGAQQLIVKGESPRLERIGA